MATNQLTDAAVRNAKAKASPYKLTDGGGLHLLVSRAGGRLWRLAYRHGGKQKTLCLGAYPTVGLASARQARDAAKRVLHEGRDPSFAKRLDARREPDEAPSTFKVVAKAWFDARKARWTPSHADRVWSRVEHDLVSPLGAMLVSEVDGEDVLMALRRIEARGAVETAHRVKGYASDIFRFARAAKLSKGDPTENLTHALASRAPKVRRAALKARELPEFLQKLAGYDGGVATRLALTFAMLTFVRTGELRHAKWEQFEGLEGEGPLWRIPAEVMKMRQEHLVPLSTHAVMTLKKLRQVAEGSLYLFGASTRSGVISENTMLYALYRMGYHSRATVHGFRGTASTTLNENGFNRDWIERQLAHTEQDQVRAAYNAAEWLADRRRMMQWWGDYLSKQGLLI